MTPGGLTPPPPHQLLPVTSSPAVNHLSTDGSSVEAGPSGLDLGAHERNSGLWTDLNRGAPSSTYPPPHGSHRAEEFDLAVGKEGIHPEEEFIEEIYSQLWIVPKPEVRVQESPGLNGGGLVWVRNDLVRDRKVILADCFPVSKSHRFEGTLKKIQLATQIWEGGSRPSYAEIVKRFPMAEGGRWVWQEDRPRATQRGCGQRGRPPWRPPKQ
jgi:hypothetical protein